MRALLTAFGDLDSLLRALILVGVGLVGHGILIVAQQVVLWFSARGSRLRLRRLQSLATLLSSAMLFALYFLILGLILAEFGVSLTAYLASASVLGLALGFGSQGIVQDVVTGLTLIFSDFIDVGDLVEYRETGRCAYNAVREPIIRSARCSCRIGRSARGYLAATSAASST
jgi:small conductance mechanosensitive channel